MTSPDQTNQADRMRVKYWFDRVQPATPGSPKQAAQAHKLSKQAIVDMRERDSNRQPPRSGMTRKELEEAYQSGDRRERGTMQLVVTSRDTA